MNQIAHLQGKFKNLTEMELLEVVNFFVDENKYNCVEEYITFEDFYALSNYSGNFKRSDVERYFTNEYYPLYKLKDFYKSWKN